MVSLFEFTAAEKPFQITMVCGNNSLSKWGEVFPVFIDFFLKMPYKASVVKNQRLPMQDTFDPDPKITCLQSN